MLGTQITARDPLLYDLPLLIKQTFYPLGFPVQLHTNSEQIREAAAHVWSRCEPAFPTEPLQLRFAVDATAVGERPPALFPRAQGHLYSAVHSSDNFCISDFQRGFAYGWFSPAMVCDPGYFRYHFLEAVTYVTLNALHLTPIHAACIGLCGAGLVLCGQSGAGKTSLAFACARRGWEFVCDDASHLVRNHADPHLIVGKPHYIRFRESARSLFAELVTCLPSLRANGKMDIEAASAELGIERIRPQIRAAAVVFLNRDGASPAALRPYPKDQAREFMEETICVGEEHVRVAQRRSLDRFLDLPILQLTYSGFDDAERCLRAFLEKGNRL